MKLDIMYCSFDFVRAIRRCHSCMDFLWIAFFDSISYLLQSRKVHLLKNQWNILLRRKNFAIFQIYPFSLWDNADVRVWEDQGGKYQVGWWRIFLEYIFTFRPINPNDLQSVKVFLHSSQTQFVHGGGGRGWCVCNLNSTQMTKKSEYSHWCPLYN